MRKACELVRRGCSVHVVVLAREGRGGEAGAISDTVCDGAS